MNFKDKLIAGYYTTYNNEYPDYQLRDTDRWEHGHSSGLSEVHNYFSEFVELIK